MFDLLQEEKPKAREKQDKLEAAMEAIRRKAGSDSAITLGFQDHSDIGIRKR